jgi:signal transduction histidine kinase/CheY-like chemotaxis protein
MTAPDRGSWRRRTQAAVAVMLLSGLLVAAVAWLNRVEQQAWMSTGPQEGYYWNVAQYQIAFSRLREELRAAAAGDLVDPEMLMLRVQILQSRTNILTSPSELTGYYEAIRGYRATAQRLIDFAQKVLSHADRAAVQRERAAALLAACEEHEATVLSLANEIRLEEIRAREAHLDGIVARRTVVITIISIAWLLMVGLLVQVYRSSARLRKVAQEREEALAAERNAVRSKNVFLGMVSHELRTPLQSMLSSIDLLELQGHAGQTIQPPHGRGGPGLQPLQGIRRAAATLERQLRDLLALAQAEAGRLEVRPEPFDLIALLENCVEDFRFPAEKKGLRIDLHCDAASPRFVVADPLRVGQVIVNLVSNAVKYTASGGVQVRLLPYRGDIGRVVVEVQDTGAGIPDAVLPRLFNAFDRLEAVDARGDSGGIGLAVVRAVLAQLGGSIELRPVSERGTCFHVEIAAIPADEGTAPQAPAAGRLLVVDDQPEVLAGLAAVARELGWQCDTADGAVAGLNHAATTAYDMVLIDLNMPRRGGRELAADIRRLPGPNQKGRLVAISAAEVPDLGGVFDAQAPKPIGVQTLRKLFAASSPEPEKAPQK